MSKAWTGYGVVIFPTDPEQPRCKLIQLGPAACPDLDTAAGIAQALWKSGGEGRDLRGIVVDKWEAGKIVKPNVFKLPIDFDDKIEMTNKEYGLSLLPNDEARAAYLRGQELPPKGTPERREIDLQHADES